MFPLEMQLEIQGHTRGVAGTLGFLLRVVDGELKVPLESLHVNWG